MDRLDLAIKYGITLPSSEGDYLASNGTTITWEVAAANNSSFNNDISPWDVSHVFYLEYAQRDINIDKLLTLSLLCFVSLPKLYLC